jgi:hypothetical protein
MISHQSVKNCLRGAFRLQPVKNVARRDERDVAGLHPLHDARWGSADQDRHLSLSQGLGGAVHVGGLLRECCVTEHRRKQ